MGLGAPEIVGIVIVVLVLFGGKKIPELAKGLGSGIKNFKKALKDDKDDKEDEIVSTMSSNEVEQTTKVNLEQNETKTV